MIRRIVGTCDGSDIVLKLNDAGLWITTVPAKPNGEYAVELWAEDDAENRTYFCTVLLSYDITQLCCHVRILRVGAGWSSRDVAAVFGARQARLRASVRSVRTDAKVRAVRMQVVRCRICGR